MPSYSVLIIDDHPVVADSVAALVRSIRSDLHIEISHSLKNAQTVLARSMVPSLIVTDLSLPDSKGVGTVEQIFQQISRATGKTGAAKVVVFSGIEHAVLKHQCLSLGVIAFVTKSEDSKALRQMLESCLLPVLPKTMPSDSHGQLLGEPAFRGVAPLKATLTKKQSAIWQDLAAGYSNAEIADRHGVGINTIKTHVKDIFDRIGARNRTEAAKLYFNNQAVT
jgi:DNA-binding NarL/FixJ family response regulator